MAGLFIVKRITTIDQHILIIIAAYHASARVCLSQVHGGVVINLLLLKMLLHLTRTTTGIIQTGSATVHVILHFSHFQFISIYFVLKL